MSPLLYPIWGSVHKNKNDPAREAAHDHKNEPIVCMRDTRTNHETFLSSKAFKIQTNDLVGAPPKTLRISEDTSMINIWHQATQREGEGRQHTVQMIADSGTNVDLVNYDIDLDNERPSNEPSPISASQDSIPISSKGEMGLGPEC